MDSLRRQLIKAEIEKARIQTIYNVTKQYMDEANYNYEQYVKSIHAASVSFEADEEKVKQQLKSELDNSANAVVSWLRANYGKITLMNEDPTGI